VILAVGLGTGVFPDGAQHLAQCDLAQRLDIQGQGAYQQFVEHHAQRVYANTSGIPGAGTDDPQANGQAGHLLSSRATTPEEVHHQRNHRYD
jgi:hypothetical protein